MTWLASLKPGDTVIIDRGGRFYGGEQIAKVEKVGKLHATIGKEKFNLRNGYRAGDHSYHTPLLREPTPEALQRIARAKLEETVENLMHKPGEWLKRAPEDALITLRDAILAAKGEKK